MKIKPILLLVLAGVLMVGCTLTPNITPPTTQLDKNFLEYFAFPIGSWWVYREIHTDNKDSMYVIMDSMSIAEDLSIDEKYEELFYHIKTKDSIRMYHAFATSVEKYNEIFCILDEITNINNPTIPYTTRRLFYPERYWKSTFFETKYLDSIVLQNNTIMRNILYTQKNNPSYDPHVSAEYYAKGVGLIRREYWNGEVWELEKYHVVQ